MFTSPTAYEILVIILSSTLAIFLILAIILTIYLIKLTSEIRKVTESAGRTVDNIETVVLGATKIASPLFVAEMIGRFIKNHKRSSKEK
jgi:uncharacterized protein YoxC